MWRHNGILFFDIATSKSGPTMLCFVHFDLEMCFAPQQRALFRHRNFQKWSGAGVFWTFWLRNVLRATTACTFSTSHLASWLRTRRFSEPTFRPSGATNHWKNTLFRDFPTLTLSLLWSSLFYSSLLSDSSHLCFSSVHIVGSLTSKLPSVTHPTLDYYYWTITTISVMLISGLYNPGVRDWWYCHDESEVGRSDAKLLEDFQGQTKE